MPDINIAPKNRTERRQLAQLIDEAKLEDQQREWDKRGVNVVASGDWYGLEMVRRWNIKRAELKRRGR